MGRAEAEALLRDLVGAVFPYADPGDDSDRVRGLAHARAIEAVAVLAGAPAAEHGLAHEQDPWDSGDLPGAPAPGR